MVSVWFGLGKWLLVRVMDMARFMDRFRNRGKDPLGLE